MGAASRGYQSRDVVERGHSMLGLLVVKPLLFLGGVGTSDIGSFINR